MIPRLVLLTDRSQLRLGRGLLRTVRECAAAGLEAVVVREHDLAPDARHALVAELAAVDGLTVISSRIPDPAADGLHLAAEQPRPGRTGNPGWMLARRHADARAAIWPLESRSCHSAAEVEAAAAEGMAWVTLSPYAASASKPGYGPAVPSDAFAGHPIPVLALGGVTAANAGSARAAGAHGVAVMGAVMRADDPAALVARLLREVA
jgi:thiamine-phosphate pyrophosphorylase